MPVCVVYWQDDEVLFEDIDVRLWWKRVRHKKDFKRDFRSGAKLTLLVHLSNPAFLYPSPFNFAQKNELRMYTSGNLPFSASFFHVSPLAMIRAP